MGPRILPAALFLSFSPEDAASFCPSVFVRMLEGRFRWPTVELSPLLPPTPTPSLVLGQCSMLPSTGDSRDSGFGVFILIFYISWGITRDGLPTFPS